LSAGVAAITRSEFIADQESTFPFQICASGSGSDESTKCYDGDVLGNLFTWEGAQTPTASLDSFVNFHRGGAGVTGFERKRWRFALNAFGMTGMRAGTNKTAIANAAGAGLDQVAIYGNAIYKPTISGSDAPSLFQANVTNFDSANNVCGETGSGSCDLFTGETETASDLNLSAIPWTVTPGDYTAFDFSDLVPSNNGALDGTGELDAIPTDIDGDARPNNTTDPGVQEIN
jgi:hypothetical protein